MRAAKSFNLPAKMALRLGARARLETRKAGKNVSESEVIRRALVAYLEVNGG